MKKTLVSLIALFVVVIAVVTFVLTRKSNPCDPNPCEHGTCSSQGERAVCACEGNWAGVDCAVCPAGCYVNGSGQCVDDLCLPNPCLNEGTCTKASESAVCGCSGNWTGPTCATCPAGFGGANCDPVPTITKLEIDCSGGKKPGHCISGGTNHTYPVTFSVTNATLCTANTINTSGSGLPGSTSNCVVNGDSGTFTYTTGSDKGSAIRITVTLAGSGGSANAYIDAMLE